MTQTKTAKRLPKAIRLGVSVALIALIIYLVGDPQELLDQILSLSGAAIAVILLVFTLNRILMTYKWLRLLKLRELGMPFWRSVQIYCAATLWGMLLPTSLGADAIRAVCAVREKLPAEEVIASIAIERVIGMLATTTLAFVALILLRINEQLPEQLTILWWVCLGVIAIGILGISVGLNPRFHDLIHVRILGRLKRNQITRLLEQSHRAFVRYRTSLLELWRFFFLSLLENSFPIVTAWLVAWGMGIFIDPLQIAAAVPLAFLAARVPYSIAGIGVFEAVFVLILSAGNVELADAVSIAIVGRILQISAWAPWLFAYQASGGSLPKEKLVSE